jgi:hypothetical protein
MSQDRFTQYGKTFQLKIIAALLKDKTFLQQIYDILIPEYFDSEANVWIVDTIMKYYPEYKQVPTLEVFKVKALSKFLPRSLHQLSPNVLPHFYQTYYQVHYQKHYQTH